MSTKETDEMDSLPVPSLLFPPPISEISSTANDVFGGTKIASPKNDNQKAGTLFQFWHRESAEDQEERVQREFEELSKTREARMLADERRAAMRKDRRRVQERDRQNRHREKKRNIKIASGWRPNQKRVSVHISCNIF